MCVVRQRQRFARNCCWKLLRCSSCASLHSFSPRHTPYDNEKKKVGLTEELNHGKDMCCSLIQPKTEEEDLWEKERSCCHWFSLLFVPRPNGECFLSSSWLSLFLSVSPLSVCGDGTFLVQLSCRQTRETLSLAYFLRRVINFVSFASASIVMSQAGGRRDRVLLLGNLTPIPLHFQRNPRHVYLFICCVSVLPLAALQIVKISWG